MNKQIVKNAWRSLRKTVQKHSPEILTGIGIAGMIATAAIAVKATPKALKMIEEKEGEVGKSLTGPEVVKTTWKCYIPAAVSGVCSAACIIGASSINARRNTALVTAPIPFRRQHSKSIKVKLSKLWAKRKSRLFGMQ